MIQQSWNSIYHEAKPTATSVPTEISAFYVLKEIMIFFGGVKLNMMQTNGFS